MHPKTGLTHAEPMNAAAGSEWAAPGIRLSNWTRLGGTAVALAIFAAAMWFAWLGWDHEFYDVDGVAQGPYRTWQVAGCGLSIVSAAVLAFLRVPRTAAIFVLAIAADLGFAVPWAVDASREDASGLWVVGLFFLVVGGGVGLAVLLAATSVVRASGPSATKSWYARGVSRRVCCGCRGRAESDTRSD